MALVCLHPDLLPESADPQGSERFENVTICHELIECHHKEINFYDDIEKNKCFIIEDKSPEYNGYVCHMFKGTVIKESNGDYSWWKNIKQGEIKI